MTDHSHAGGVPEDQIKDEIALLAPGAKDNDTVFVRKNGKVMAYVWSASDMQWSVLGEVTEGPGDNINVAKKVRSRAYLLRFPSSSCPVNKKDCFFYKRENKVGARREGNGQNLVQYTTNSNATNVTSSFFAPSCPTRNRVPISLAIFYALPFPRAPKNTLLHAKYLSDLCCSRTIARPTRRQRDGTFITCSDPCFCPPNSVCKQLSLLLSGICSNYVCVQLNSV